MTITAIVVEAPVYLQGHTVVQLGKHVRLYLTYLTIDVQAQNPAISCALAVKVHINNLWLNGLDTD